MKLQKKTIESALESTDKYAIKAAVKNCLNNPAVDRETYRKWKESDELPKQMAATYAVHQVKKENFREKLDTISDTYGYEFARELLFRAYVPSTNLWTTFPAEEYGKYYSEKLMLAAIKKPISSRVVARWIESDKWYDQISALYYCKVDPLILNKMEINWVLNNTMDKDVLKAAVMAARMQEWNGIELQKLYNNTKSITKRIAVLQIYQGRLDVQLDFNPEELTDEEIKTLPGVPVSKSKIQYWWSSGTKKEFTAAIYLSKGHKMPYVFFNKAVRSSDPVIREAGLVATYGLPGFEPACDIMPDDIYKKCIGNVIVKGKLAKDTSTRSTGKNTGRADHLFITDIIGDFYGEKVGISFYDCFTQYQSHKNATVSDFNASFTENTTGIHFFTNETDARKFYY